MENQIAVTSIKLAIQFSEASNIPIRFREKKVEEDKTKEEKPKEEKSKINFNTLIEKRFQENVDAWKMTITHILKKVEPKQAWRFINLTPLEQPDIKSAAYHIDFIDFTDYFVLRRDKENCDHNETGCLAFLHTAFQKKIERTL